MASINPQRATQHAALTRSSRATPRSWLRPVGMGVAVGLFAMFAAGVYSFEASTEPGRGWTPLDGQGVVLIGCFSGLVAGWIVIWRTSRHRTAVK
jgi:hypothetical protein